MATNLYVEVLSDVDTDKVKVSIETYICLFISQLLPNSNDLKINFVKLNISDKNQRGIFIQLKNISYVSLKYENFEKNTANLCKLPVLITNVNVVIAGLCAVCRSILKNGNSTCLRLLGFKGACLMAPAETSNWTKFCEVDFISATQTILNLSYNDEHWKNKRTLIELPVELGQFESHLNQPIRMHNIYKIARQQAKILSKIQDVEENLLSKFSELNATAPVTSLETIVKKEKQPRTNKSLKSKVRYFL